MTDKFQLDIIELNKLEQYKDENDKLLQWCKFIKAPGRVSESIMEKYPEIKKAKEELDKINADENEKNIALARERALHDAASLRHDGYTEGYNDGITKGITKGYNDGITKGIEKGIAKGKLEGEKSRSNEIAKKLISKGMTISEISAITDLSEDEVRKIINE